METVKDYIEIVNTEIKKHMKDEIDHGISDQNEYDLCVLFKNRKYALDMLETGKPTEAAEVQGHLPRLGNIAK